MPAPRRRRPAYARRRTGSEEEFQRAVLGLMGYTGWRFYHPPDNRPNANGRVQNVVAGFPDIFAVRRHRIVVAELKTEKGRVSDAQHLWLAEFRAFALALDQVVAALDLACVRSPDDAADNAGAIPPRLEVYLWRPEHWKEIERVLAPEDVW